MMTNLLRRRRLLAGAAASLGLGLAPLRGRAQGDTLRIGFLAPLSGPFGATGRQMEAAAKLYVARHGSSTAGRPVELVVKDDTGTADVAKRLAQELLVNDKVHVLAGFGLTPLALAAAPLATQARTPMVVTAAAASSITEASPFIVRSSFTAAQVVTVLADWAAGQGIRRVVSLVTDYAPGVDAEKHFNERFGAGGGRQIAQALRVPLRSPDFAPFLQRVRDAGPDALFAFVPAGVGATLMKQFTERGLDRAGIRLIAEGSVTDDDILNTMGDAALGVVTAHHYSAAHPSAANQAFVDAFGAATGGLRPNFMAVGSWDGMRLVCEAAKAATAGGAALLEAMKGRSFESPRGPLRIDAATRDVVHNVYVRRVARIGGQLWNQEFATVTDVKDPGKGRG